MRRALAAASVVAILLVAGSLFGQTTPTPKPAKPQPQSKAKPKKVPLDFSGVWVIDPQASTGVAPQMANAVLQVRQNGNRIWIEQIESAERQILSEQIVVDGKKYEKALGNGVKGTLEAQWGNDDDSLWLQVVAGQEGDPSAAYQRMVWKLREGGKIWTRQSKTIEPDGVWETFLVFRKREAAKK
jgi:hypothetical protein